MSNDLYINPASNKGDLEIDPSATGGVLLLEGTTIIPPLFSFVTEASSGGVYTFDPYIAVNSEGTANWDLGDGSIVTGDNGFTHNYVDGSPKTVKLYQGTLTGIDDIYFLDLYYDNIVGNIDLTEFINLTTLRLSINPQITGVTLPSNSLTWQYCYLNSCDITGTVDASGLIGTFPYDFRVNNNSNLTNVIFPDDVSTIMTQLYLNSTSLSSIDLTMFQNLGGNVYLQSNSELESVTLPTSPQGVDLQLGSCPKLQVIDASGLYGMYSLAANTCPSLNTIICPSLSINMTQFQAYNGDLTGTLDMSPAGGYFGGYFRVSGNDNLTGIINPPSSSRPFTRYDVASCDITGTLDCSGLTGMGGVIAFNQNTNLNYVLFGASSQTISSITGSYCDLIGTLDISGLTGMGGTFNVQYNSSLNKIENPVSSNSITLYYASFCGLTGTLDVSGLTGIGGNFSIQSNFNLSEILFPDGSLSFSGFYLDNCAFSSLDLSNFDLSGIAQFNNNSSLGSIEWGGFGDFYRLYVNSCALDTSTIDTMFSKLNTYYSSNTPTHYLTVYASSGTNSPPTDGSSNSDILSLETIFSNAGQTLTITINT